MKVTIVSAVLLVALATCSADGQNEPMDKRFLVMNCEKEYKSKLNFDTAVFNNARRERMWADYLEARDSRKKQEKIVAGFTDCRIQSGYFDKSYILSDEQLFGQLCNEERVWGARSSSDKLIKVQLESFQKNAERFRRQFGERIGKSECPAPNEIELENEGLAIAAPYEEYFDACKKRVLFEYMEPKIREMKVKSSLAQQSNLALEAALQTMAADYGIEEQCGGPIAECCGRRLIEVVNSTASLQTAQFLVEKLSTTPKEEKIEATRAEKNWEEVFTNLCILEHKTGAGNQYYNVQLKALQSINKSVRKERESLGQILNKRSCPASTVSSLVPINSRAQVREVDARCEEEVKSTIMCQAYKKAYHLDSDARKYSRQKLEELYVGWCKKAQAVEKMMGPTKRKAHKPPKGCNEETKAAISEQAGEEAALVLETLQLKAIGDAAVALKQKLEIGREAAFEILQAAEKVFKKDYKDEVEPVKKEQNRQAYELVKAKAVKVGTAKKQ